MSACINDARDSPIVDDVGDENQYAAIVAVTYYFQTESIKCCQVSGLMAAYF